jgi:hypothetical protein
MGGLLNPLRTELGAAGPSPYALAASSVAVMWRAMRPDVRASSDQVRRLSTAARGFPKFVTRGR